MGYIQQFSRPGLSIAPVLSQTGKYDICIRKGEDEVTLNWEEQDALRKIATSVHKLNIELCGTRKGANQAQEPEVQPKAKASIAK